MIRRHFLLGASALTATLALPTALLGDRVALAAPRRLDGAAGLKPRPWQPHPIPDAPPAPVTAELLLLHGTNNNTGIDPKLGRIPALSKPPFSAYNSYDLLKREALELLPKSPASTRLPNKGELVVTYQGATQRGGPKKYIVDLSIQRHGAAILPLLQVNANAGEMMFAAVPGYRGGVLVIGVKIVP